MLTRRICGVEKGDSPLVDPRAHPEVCYNQDPWGLNDGLHKASTQKPDEAILRRVGRGEKGPLRSKSRVFRRNDHDLKQRREQRFQDSTIQKRYRNDTTERQKYKPST